MTNRTTSNKMLSIVAVAAMLVATTTIAALVTQPVAAQSISIPTDNNQTQACDTAGLSSAISDSCNGSFNNNVTNSGGVLRLGNGTGDASISIPTSTAQHTDCETAGASSGISASCNNNATNTVVNSGGIKVRPCGC
jgi:opacity protein-like surface antigen